MLYPNLKQIQNKVDTSYLYRVLAHSEKNKEIAGIFDEMSEISLSYAQALGEKNKSSLPGPSLRVQILKKIAKYFGYEFILGILMETEKSMSYNILSQKKSKKDKIKFPDTSHLTILKNILNHHPHLKGQDIARFKKRRGSIGGNALRAGVLGGNDGLVSNFSLVMGVAGATSGNSEIILAGTAGLLAGALSMALGEWISVKSSQELYENQIELEKRELKLNPKQEERELVLIYRTKGIVLKQAKKLAAEVMQNKEQAHHILIKEELGIDEDDLRGSAIEAALSSFFLFALGAIVPVFPFFIWEEKAAIIISCFVSSLGLFTIGTLITLFTGKSIIFSGTRQVLFGAGAGALTFVIGKIIGTSIIG